MAYLRNHLVFHPLLFEALSNTSSPIRFATSMLSSRRWQEESSEASTIPSSSSSLSSSSSSSRTLWIDTDVGFDDLVAISSLLHYSKRNDRDDQIESRSVDRSIDIGLVTTVGGIQANPLDSAKFLQTELLSTTTDTTAVIPGLAPRTIQDEEGKTIPSWLENTRQDLKSLYSKEATLENHHTSNSSSSSSSSSSKRSRSSLDTEKGRDQLIQFLTSEDDHSVDLLCLGPLTNIAYCLDDDIFLQDVMASKLRQVWIMGGNNPSISRVPEFNFATDALAAAQVLEGILQNRIRIVPAQTCEIQNNSNQKKLEATWERLTTLATSKESSSTLDLQRHPMLHRVFQINPEFSSLKYDTICAFAYYRGQDQQVPIEQIQMQMRVDSTSGALLPVAEEDDEVSGHSFVTQIPLRGENGFFQWIQEAIEAR
ncbi:MAG: hypothetical protein SGBAC_011038 [Bacillariaceae sp.]